MDSRKSCPFPACCSRFFSLFCGAPPPLSRSFSFPSFCIPALFNLCWHFQSSDVQTQTAQTAAFSLQLICFLLDTKHSSLISHCWLYAAPRPPMDRIISAEPQLLLPVECQSKTRGFRAHQRTSAGASWTWETPVVQRDPAVTNDIKKMSLFENFSTVERFYTIIARSQNTTGLLFSVDVCVPAFTKPNISLPLNHLKLFLLINLHKYFSVSLMIRLLTNKVDLLWTFTDSPVLAWPIQIPFFNLSYSWYKCICVSDKYGVFWSRRKHEQGGIPGMTFVASTPQQCCALFTWFHHDFTGSVSSKSRLG